MNITKLLSLQKQNIVTKGVVMKITKRLSMMLVAFVAVFAVAFTFTGCTTGTYKFWGLKIGDREIAISELTEEQQTILLSQGMTKDSYIQLKGNETFVMSSTFVFDEDQPNFKQVMEIHGTYALFDQKLEFYIEPVAEDSEKYELTIEGKSIYFVSPFDGLSDSEEPIYVIFRK